MDHDDVQAPIIPLEPYTAAEHELWASYDAGQDVFLVTTADPFCTLARGIFVEDPCCLAANMY